MTYFPEIQVTGANGQRVIVSPFRSLKVSEMTRLVGGSFFGSSLDTGLWTATPVNGGTVTVSGGTANIATNTTANGSATLQTTVAGRYMAGMANTFASGLRLGDTGTANNARQWGLFNADRSEGIFFELSGQILSVNTRKASATTAHATLTAGVWTGNGPAPVLNTNFNLYEISFVAPLTVEFYQNGVLIHRVGLGASTTVSEGSLRPTYTNINSAGSTSNCTMHPSGAALMRYGSDSSVPRYRRTNTVETAVVLKNQPGRLHRVLISDPGSGGARLTLYDATTADAAAIIMNLDTVSARDGIEINIPFRNALTFSTTSTAGDYTIVFD